MDGLRELYLFIGSFLVAVLPSSLLPDSADVLGSNIHYVINYVSGSEKPDNWIVNMNELIKTFTYLVSLAGSIYAFLKLRKKNK